MLVRIAHSIDINLARLDLAALDFTAFRTSDRRLAEQVVDFVFLVRAGRLVVVVGSVGFVRLDQESGIAAMFCFGGAAAEDLSPGIDCPLRWRVQFLEPASPSPSGPSQFERPRVKARHVTDSLPP